MVLDIKNISRLQFNEELRLKLLEKYNFLVSEYCWNPSTDIRLRAFTQLDNLLRSYSLTLLFYEDYLSHDQFMSEKVKPATTRDAQDVRNQYLVFAQNSYIYNLSGIIESTFRNILRAVVPSNKGAADFKRIKKSLLEALGNAEPEHCYDAVTLLFIIRNCIHNNGIHFSRDNGNSSVNYRGKVLEFNHGAVQENSDFVTMHYVSMDVVEVLIYIVSQKKVYSLDTINETGI